VIDASNSGNFETTRNAIIMLLGESPAQLCVIATGTGVGAKDVGFSRREKGW